MRFVERIPDWVLIALAALAAIGLGLTAALLVFARRLRISWRRADHLAALADTDVLTGLLNRRGVEQRLRAEVSRATRHSRPLAVAFADLKGLKGVNDRYGHETGDEVIKRVAEVLAAEARDGDICGRMGGDEYAVALVEAGEAGTDAFRERVFAGVDEVRRDLDLDTDWDLTLGTALFPRDGDTAEELIAVADRRLYAERGIRLSR